MADNVKYECGAAAEGIVFRPTMMFQTRVYSFPLTNLSTARLDFKFQVLSAAGTQVREDACMHTGAHTRACAHT